MFTTALVEGLATGDADQDEDGWVSLNELYDYVFDKVREQNPHQTPSRQVELEGELYVARSRRRRIRPAPIPPDLQAALTNISMYARLGAVGELRSRLASENLPVAAGAYSALAELARTDIQAVADPAAAALAEAAMQPAQTELNFGRIERGSPSPHQTVQLLGPPIARACVPRPSHAWIHVDDTTEGLDISVDTTDAGALHGSLDLKGPTGAAMIAIEIEIVSPPPQVPPGRDQSTPVGPRVAAPAAPPEGTPREPRDPPANVGRDISAATGEETAARIPPASGYHPISKRFWCVVVYLLPVTVYGALVSFIAVPLFVRDRVLRMNVIQAVEVYLTLAPPIVFNVLAVHTSDTPLSVLLSVLAGIGYAFSTGLLVFCVIQVIRRKQPRIPGLSRTAYRITYRNVLRG